MAWPRVIVAMSLVSFCLGGAEPPCEGLIVRLRPLHSRLGKPGPADWRTAHPEPGQTFREYRQCDPVLPTADRRRIYVQPLGAFSPGQQRVLDLTVEFMGLYLGLPVVKQEPIPASAIPAKARRRLPGAGWTQFLAPYLLDELLLPGLPQDAAARIALTATDLWPGKGWNFVFGEASTGDRVGVWSTHRFGDPQQSEATFRLCLLRAMGTAVHETCHMFTMQHCTAYACCMNGSNSLEESDRVPLWLCPQCLAKLCWAVGFDPARRFEALAAFCRRNGLMKEAAFYGKCLERCEKNSGL